MCGLKFRTLFTLSVLKVLWPNGCKLQQHTWTLTTQRKYPAKWFMYTTYNKIFAVGEIVAKAHAKKDFIYLLLLLFFSKHLQNFLF